MRSALRDRQVERHGRAVFQSRVGLLDQPPVEHVIDLVALRLDTAACRAIGHRRTVQQRVEVNGLRLPVIGLALDEQIGVPDEVLKMSHAQLRHDLADLLRDEGEIVDQVFRLAGEFLAKLRVLRGDSDRAGVEVALAHHDAAERDHRRRAEREFLRAEQPRDHDIAPGLELSIRLQADAPAQAVEHQGLMRLGDAEFKGQSGVFDRAERAGPGPAVIAADHDQYRRALWRPRRRRSPRRFRTPASR